LASCYKTSLQLAVQNGIKTIAFPAISCGVYRFPKKLAAEIAVREVKNFLSKNDLTEKVMFVCFDEEMYEIYLKFDT